VKTKRFKKKQKGIAERKTESVRKSEIPYKSISLGLLLWLFITWLFFGHGIVRTPSLVEGQKAPSTIVASVDFICENLDDTELSRNKAVNAVPPVFSIDPAPAQRAAKFTDELFGRMNRYATASTNEQQRIISSMNDLMINTPVDATTLITAIPTNTIREIKTTLISGIKEVMGTGILSDEYRVTLFGNQPDQLLTITTGEDLPPRRITQKDIHSTRTAVWAITQSIKDATAHQTLNRLLPAVVIDNMTYDKATTEALQEKEADAVEPSLQKYPAGTTLVRAGEPATRQTLLLLKHHEQQRIEDQEMFEQVLEIFGNGIFLLAGLIATAVILRLVAPRLIHHPEHLLLLVILSLFTLGTARLLTYLSVQYALIPPFLLTYLTPHALAVLLASILLGGSAAICLGFWTSFATAVLLSNSFNVFALGILITITAASTARNVHRRSSLFKAGLWVCIVKLLYVLVVAILNRPLAPILVGQSTAAIVSGMLSTILTLLLIPVFEKLFKITTDITLLELSDMGHPLLQKMAIQAPGTYHHSLMVATLAQNAAEAIGANSLLVRVCAYYHDIGKMAKPEFFTENIQHKENPHDELSPHMSALVISSHVKEGLTLAKRHKLPQPILDAIEQHHGNGLISYFYHKAKTMQGDGTSSMADLINDSDFRYGGAPAVTPEMAILSLADASEAASRSIEKPTPQKISNMMDSIFSAKIRDGQMDYANLTMAEINVVKQSFIFSLSNMLHGRIPYPTNHENKHSQPTENPSASGTPPSKTD
jgi:putative nucleotidyltransferase with HDIG domain